MEAERRSIAVDFDGTIVEDAYPGIGRERPYAIRTLLALQERGFALILYTCREGQQLQEAVDWCAQRGLVFYGVNQQYEGEAEPGTRKIEADIYIDDRNYGGLPSWGEIYHHLVGGTDDQGPSRPGDGEPRKPPPRGGLRRLFGGLKCLPALLAALTAGTADAATRPQAAPQAANDDAFCQALADVYAVDQEDFATHVMPIADAAKSAFLREYMALMTFTAANTERNYEQYIQASDRALDAAERSPAADNLSCQLHIHKAMVLMYDGSMLSAGLQFWKAYRRFKAGESSCPTLDAQLLYRGLFNIVLSQVPDKWRALKGLLGLADGDLAEGFRQIEQYRQRVQHRPGLHAEALIFSFANVFFSHDQGLSQRLEELIRQCPSPVVRYAYLLTCGRRQMGEAATWALAQCSDDDLRRFPLLLHQRERWALRAGHLQEALQWGRRFTSTYTGKSNAANGFLDMAYAQLLLDNKAAAQRLVQQCLATESDFDIDQRSRNEASRLMQSDTALLRARLLYDFGRYQEARQRLARMKPRQQDLPEWHFRLARACELLGDTAQALNLYDKTIELSQNSTLYFGPYAAVHAADICLARRNNDKCRQYCLTARKLNNGEYSKELEQRIDLTLRTLK